MSVKVSVIACSRKAGDAEGLRHSLLDYPMLREGTDFEFIELVAVPSMGNGYNAGIKIATTDYLVFTHGDVTVWGGRKMWDDAIVLLDDATTGFVGLAGAEKLPSSLVWWEAEQKRGAVAHTSDGQTYMSYFGPYGQAQVMDGVFLACHRRVFQRIGPWNPALGFHFYDIDITLRASAAGFKNCVVPLTVHHGSVGAVGPEWLRSRRKMYESDKVLL